jgi:hypothetical protein
MEEYLATLDRVPDVRSAYSSDRGILDEPRSDVAAT